MAVELGERNSVRKRRRRKLLVDQRVEVRSVEDGFQGSWHSGSVIACHKQSRRVKYDHILLDDGSDHLVVDVDVSLTLDGNGYDNENNYRGCIRPLPPCVEFNEWGLPYGLCVDVYYKEAWWEGVVFDHEDGSDERRVFFPDLGDELKTAINMLRITQDWDEVTEKWQRRGTWLFLELIEEYEQEVYLAVSVKQIWYDLRDKEGFKKVREWTCTIKNLWKELVLEVIGENFSVILEDVIQVLDRPGDFLLESHGGLESATTVLDFDMSPEADLANSFAIVPVESPLRCDLVVDQEKSDVDQLTSTVNVDGSDMNLFADSDVSCHGKLVCVVPQALSLLPSNPDGISSSSSMTTGEQLSSNNSIKINRKHNCSTQRKTGNWLPAGSDILPGAESCPAAVTEYVLKAKNKRKPGNSLTTNVRKHLSFLGWKIEFTRDNGFHRLKYTSPKGKCYYSLLQICQEMREPTKELLSSISFDDQRSLHVSPDDRSSAMLLKQPGEGEDPDYCPQTVMSPRSHVVPVPPEFCPQAVVEYYMHGLDSRSKKSILRSKARMHLSAVGWLMWNSYQRGKPEIRYISPRGMTYYTLKAACKICMNEGVSEGGVLEGVPSGCGPIQSTYISEEDDGQLSSGKSSSTVSNEQSGRGSRESSCISLSTKLVECSKENVRGRRKMCRKKRDDLLHLASHFLQKQPNLEYVKDGSEISLIGNGKLNPEDQNVRLPKLKRRRVFRAPKKLKDDLESSRPTRVLRSSKRVQQVVTPSSIHHNPRTVLSWLIDNNVVLPREKVHYRSKKNHSPMAEGRITRDGIKCSCCQKVFTLTGFEVHAGSKRHRPAGGIFLEDGRSLLDCQMQIIRDNKMESSTRDCQMQIIGDNKMGSSTRESLDRTKGTWHQGNNDHICTVCHYGGELILCDQCPSAFHKSCIGLKDVPDGDWFCPSCCCRICRQLKNNTVHLMDDIVLTCSQCEHRYHIGCLKNKGAHKLKNCPEENWFCCKKCEKIFLGLHKILGKPIPVGVDNLTWTLLKPMASDSSDIEALTENYSKLNIALGVMHECFEPVKEPRTQRDLVEDVIFSRGSDLNRLNFQGFYTVLLERNDELITVATVRVYGDKVAEAPLVGTRFQYRRLGMCRILMNELEKKLMELGVERLVLPAVRSVLNTWTTSFGFAKMTNSERLQFVDYTFLDFQDTVMCQKLLMKTPSAESSPTKGTQRKIHDIVNGNGDNIDLDGSSVVSEVSQAEQVVESGIMEQRPAVASGNNGYGSDNMVDMVVMVDQGNHFHCKPCHSETSGEYLLEDGSFKQAGWGKGNLRLKFYKRRRV